MGTLPGTVILTDSSFFNELRAALTLGTTLEFTFDATTIGSGSPDEFSVFLLDAAGMLPLFTTTDPTGADALLVFDITGGPGDLMLFGAPGGEATINIVPEPSSLILSALGLGMVTLRRRFRRDQGFFSRPVI
jgi:hypothetical protein